METFPSKNDFQIGWICALPIEAAAAIQMLDENFGILQEQEKSDTNTYTLGRIGRHHVVIACLPDGQYGTSSATTVAINMMRTFADSLRIGLMVGIGGGAPSADHDIRLGDIVVSRPVGSHGGVIQHDMRKVGKDGKIQRVGSLNSPPRSLLNALAQMRAAELYDDPRYPVYIQEAIMKNTRTRRTFGRPDINSDRLFEVEREHPDSATSCDQYPVEWEKDRINREEGYPQTHYGTIASGNTLVKDGKTRETIREESDALCFEMEAAGLMADFPCLVVRGICDYADSHKNKQWQGYAALAAAAFTKELLGYVPRGVSQEKLVTDICPLLEDIKEDQRKAFEQRENHHREKMERILTEDQRHCHQTFKTSTYEHYKNINPDRVEGTSDPGCGKSVLAKSLVDDFLRAPDSKVSICYFFFKDNDEQNNLATALCAILHQLFGMQPQLLKHALPSWEKNHDMIQQEVDELWHILLSAISDPIFTSAICVFDALDECQGQDQKRLIQKLEKFYNQAGLFAGKNWLKFLVTSRPYDDIQESFRSLTNSFPQIQLRGEENNDRIREEISHVVKVHMAQLSGDLKLKCKTQLRLEKELLEMEHRTYLWLHLVVNDIRIIFNDSLRPDEESIRLIPRSVNEAYERILARVTPEQVPTVRTILQIIIGARRPLTVHEMAIALGVATLANAKTVTEAALTSEGLGEKIRRLCGLFVFIHDSKLYLIHQTAREFLLGHKTSETTSQQWQLRPSDVHYNMTHICVRYLLMDDLLEKKHDKNIQCLLKYSAESWADHFRETDSSSHGLMHLVYRLYETTTERFALWFPFFWEAMMPYTKQPCMNALHLAAFNGHDSIIQKLVKNDKSVLDQQDDLGVNALQWASLPGYYGTVRLLLESGADVNAQGRHYGTALQASASQGHLHIVHELLKKGADVHAQGERYDSALQAASSKGYHKVVHELLNMGADINSQGRIYGTPLQAASLEGHLDIVQTLLENGADVNAQGGYYGNALQAACSGGYFHIVQQLLNDGADVNARGGYYGNALQAASSGGHVDIVQELLKKGAKVNAKGGFYGSSLRAAFLRGRFRVVEILLQRTVTDGNDHLKSELRIHFKDGNNFIKKRAKGTYPGAVSTGGGGATARVLKGTSKRAFHSTNQAYVVRKAMEDDSMHLYEASSSGDITIVKRILEEGINVNVQDDKYGNALQAASHNGHVEIVQRLLEKGADVNAQGGEYGNALQAASYNGHVEIVQRLLEKGADVNAQGGRFSNALQAASHNGHVEIVQRLLEKGADVNAQGGEYSNALQAASDNGHVEIVQRLLEKGADVNAQDGEYGNALQAASHNRHVEIVQRLLEKGADVNAQGGEYGNALQAASRNGHVEIVQRLVEKGADVNAQGGEYGNALYAAVLQGYSDIVLLLLEKGADVVTQ